MAQPSFPIDILRFIRDLADIPVKWRLSEALYLSIFGIGKVTPPKMDLFAIKRQFITTQDSKDIVTPLQRTGQVCVIIPLTSDKWYRLVFVESLHWERKHPSSWKRMHLPRSRRICFDFSGLIVWSSREKYFHLHDTYFWMENPIISREKVSSFVVKQTGRGLNVLSKNWLVCYEGILTNDTTLEVRRRSVYGSS